MIHAFMLVLILGGVQQPNPMFFRGIETCNWYAAKIVKRYGNYSYYYAVPQEHKATAYCKPVWVSKDIQPMYDH